MLNQWQEWGIERRGVKHTGGSNTPSEANEASTTNTHGAQCCQMQKPDLNVDNFAWKRWLKDTCTQAQARGKTFNYPGIPLVGNRYINAHIDTN